MASTLRLRITGRVQGVGFRAWAIGRAVEFGLRGWVRNRGDGSVEALATGAAACIAAFAAACRNGPSGARVSEVLTSPAEDDGSTGFTARPTL